MKRSIRVAASGFWGLAICISFFYILGAYFSPPYRGLDLSTQSFRVFLATAATCVLAGLVLGLWLTRERTKQKTGAQQSGRR